MQNLKWSPAKNRPKSLKEATDYLCDIRGIKKSLIQKDKSLKEFVLKPKYFGFKKSALVKHFKDLKKSIANTKVLVFGDYDVDGITSSVILSESLQKIFNIKCDVFIPNRFDYGYGLNDKSIELIKSNYSVSDYNVIYFVDCGITSKNQILKLKKLGYKTFIIDHHQTKEKKPQADFIFWSDKYTASALTYLYTKYLEMFFTKKAQLSFGVDLAGLGYVCDLGDLSRPFGRALVKKSLNILSASPRSGINELVKGANIEKKLTSYDLGFVIGPRINASGRLDDPIHSLNLLMGENIKSSAESLNYYNEKRKKETNEMFEIAVNGLTSGKYLGSGSEEKIIVVDSKDFHEGVIGLISSKLVKQFFKPTVSISWVGDTGKGSCRSIEGVNIVKVLAEVGDYLEGFGGHTMAAGFSIKRKNYKKFLTKLKDVTNTMIDSSHLTPSFNYDFDIEEGFLTRDLLDFIEQLEPFGNGNPSPVFGLKGVLLENFKLLGKKGDHLSFSLKNSGMRAIFFNGSNYLDHLNTIDSYDLLFAFQKNIWKGVVYPQLVIKDLRKGDF